MAYTAAAMYGGAAFDAAIEGVLPGDPSFALAPALVALAIVALLLLVGPRLPRWGLALLGPLGVALVAYALAASPGAGDGAVLYVWPVLWSTFFFARRGAVAILACTGVAHTITLLSLPARDSFPGRWVDVMVCASVVAVVVLILVERNELLLGRLADEARTDPLTGLLNRRGFYERAGLELAHARREQKSVALVSLDLDYFKRVNDEWGHDVGDQVLAATGARLAACSRDIDVVARIGGEEFVVLLPGSESSDADAFTQRIRSALAEDDASELPKVRVSAGVLAARVPADLETMLQQADSALYQAKRAGRNRTVAFEARDPSEGVCYSASNQ